MLCPEAHEPGGNERIRDAGGNAQAHEPLRLAYQWDAPFVLDDSRFRAAFGGTPTPVDGIIHATVTWAVATYGRTNSRPAPSGAAPAKGKAGLEPS